MSIGFFTTLVGLLNAMIGGTMTIIPSLTVFSGYMPLVAGCIFTGSVTCYTAILLTNHLGNAKSIRELLLNHFSNSVLVTKLYNFVIWLSFFSAMTMYFNLFVQQVQDLIGTNKFVPQCILVFLIIWSVFLRENDLSEIALACGIVSIITFFAFVTSTQLIQPHTPKKLAFLGNGNPALALGLLNSFTTHDFLIALIINNPDRKSYTSIIKILYMIAISTFIYFGFDAAILVNLQNNSNKHQSIIDYFNQGWAITILQLTYISHIITTFPQYVSISKIRIFQLFNLEHQHQTCFAFSLYSTIVVAICYVIFKIGVQLSIILSIAGFFLGYTFAILVPVIIHFKCVHIDRSSGYIKCDSENNQLIKQNQCGCQVQYHSRLTLYIQTFLLSLLVLGGFCYYFMCFKSEITKQIFNK